MAADSITTTIACPACSKRIDVSSTARYDGRGSAYLAFDLGLVHRHVEQHGGAVEGERDGQAP